MRRLIGLSLLLTLVLTGCASSPQASPSTPGAPSATAVSPTPTTQPPTVDPAATATTDPAPTATTALPTSDPTATDAALPHTALTLRQQVGQIFMLGTSSTAASASTMNSIRDLHIGSIFLSGHTQEGAAAVARVVKRFTALVSTKTTGGVPLWVSTDQEGGEVQVLQGPGFDAMPYAIRQADASASVLEANAKRWGSQLRAAGVNINLAPVADIVTSKATRFSNPPIGALGRQYGYSEEAIASKAGAFAKGMREAGIMPTFKHFPGLGHVTQNTDFTAHVVDNTVSPSSPDIAVYRSLTQAGPSVVMVGSAIYNKIDASQPAVFSHTVVSGILRGKLGYQGVIITDDLSAARAVTAFSPADRAIRALDAGVDMLLVSASPSVLPAMYNAVLAKAEKDPAFAKKVAASAARIVAAKAHYAHG